MSDNEGKKLYLHDRPHGGFRANCRTAPKKTFFVSFSAFRKMIEYISQCLSENPVCAIIPTKKLEDSDEYQIPEAPFGEYVIFCIYAWRCFFRSRG